MQQNFSNLSLISDLYSVGTVSGKNGWKRAQIARYASVCFQPFHTVLQSRKGKFAA
jgi:hypothetical protein